MPTDFPTKGDDKQIVLRNSNHKQFDYDYALDLRKNYPNIWNKGGNTRGTTAFTNWGKARKGDYTEAVKSWIKEREAWAARHKDNFRPAGVVAQIKWGVVGSRGISYMKSLINEEKKKQKKNMVNIPLETTVDKYSSIGIRETIKNSNGQDIEISISSLGGSLDEGLKMYYALIEHDGNSTATFKGRSASAATIFAMGAKKRKIYQNSHILVHKVLQPTMLLDYLNADDIESVIKQLKKDKKELDSLDLSLANIYYQKAKKKGKEEKDILKLMSKDTWLNASEALDWGLVNEIISEDFEYNEENQNALLNHYNLPQIPQTNQRNKTTLVENKSNKMNFIDTVKKFFNEKLGLQNADEKAGEFVASFNEDLKAHVSTQLDDAFNAKFGEVERIENEAITALKNEVSILKEQLSNRQEIELGNYVSKEDYNALEAKQKALEDKMNDLGAKIIENKTPKPPKDNTIIEGGKTGALLNRIDKTLLV